MNTIVLVIAVLQSDQIAPLSQSDFLVITPNLTGWLLNEPVDMFSLLSKKKKQSQ